jgi:hypothetical protein
MHVQSLLYDRSFLQNCMKQDSEGYSKSLPLCEGSTMDILATFLTFAFGLAALAVLTVGIALVPFKRPSH